jgi:hypothetical protein
MDIVDLREFYGGPLGAATRRLVGDHLRSRFKGTRGASVLGLGYALPYLDGWSEEAERVVAFMPARQGVARWPQAAPGLPRWWTTPTCRFRTPASISPSSSTNSS